MKRFFGAHVSSSGGFENAIKNAEFLGVNTIQVHPSPPQRWNAAPYPLEYERAFLEHRAKSGVERVFFHGIYLINLASTDAALQQRSQTSLVHYLDLSARINGDGVIFHVGSMKDWSSEREGFVQVASIIDRILAESDPRSRLILEVAAGAGSIIGDRLEELAEIFELVKGKDRVGFALDSQHLWASGYDLCGELDGVLEAVRSQFSMEKVWAVHLNDSMTALASRRDRHENLGEGLIGEKALRALFCHPLVQHIPFILETPALKDLQTAKVEVDKLRQWAADCEG